MWYTSNTCSLRTNSPNNPVKRTSRRTKKGNWIREYSALARPIFTRKWRCVPDTHVHLLVIWGCRGICRHRWAAVANHGGIFLRVVWLILFGFPKGGYAAPQVNVPTLARS